MEQIRKFLNLSPLERRLLVRAGLWVAAMRLGLSFLPFPWLRNMIATTGEISVGPGQPHPDQKARVAWAITVAARYVPRATCLTKALAAQALLRQEGVPADLRLGVAKDRDGKFQAHAWLEQEGRIILGHFLEEDYTPLGNVPWS